MLDIRVDADALKRGGDVHGRVRLQPGGTSANAAVWGAWAGATTSVLGRIGDDLQGRTVRAARRGARRARRRSRSTPRRRRARCSSCTSRGNARWSPIEARTRASSPRTCLPRSRPARCWSPATCCSRSRATRPPSRRSSARAAPLVGVEAASWPLVESFGADRFLEATAARDRRVRERPRGGGAHRSHAAPRPPRSLGERYRVAAVKLDRRGAAVSVDGRLVVAARGAILARSTRRAPATPSTACCSRCSRAAPTRRPRSPGPVMRAPRGRERRTRGPSPGACAWTSRSSLGDEVRAAARRRARRGRPRDQRDRTGTAVAPQRGVRRRMDGAIRSAGAVPAWIGVVGGRRRRRARRRPSSRASTEPGVATKVARRDLPVAVAAARSAPRR